MWIQQRKYKLVGRVLKVVRKLQTSPKPLWPSGFQSHSPLSPAARQGKEGSMFWNCRKQLKLWDWIR
jgi:hypothetical protein